MLTLHPVCITPGVPNTKRVPKTSKSYGLLVQDWPFELIFLNWKNMLLNFDESIDSDVQTFCGTTKWKTCQRASLVRMWTSQKKVQWGRQDGVSSHYYGDVTAFLIFTFFCVTKGTHKNLLIHIINLVRQFFYLNKK